MNEQELFETLYYCQNKLLFIKEVLEKMEIWEEVKLKLEELN